MHLAGAISLRTTSKEIDMSDTTETIRDAERIYRAWDDALGRKDLDAALSLYAPDVVLESPLVRHLLGREDGIVRGRDDLRQFVDKVFKTQPALRQRYRTGFFTDGKRLMWEYPRATEAGQQMDLVEVMDIADGLIQQHRVYWGWFGLKVLEDGGHRSP
jgi:ketosteroid isomerase-like protein